MAAWSWNGTKYRYAHRHCASRRRGGALQLVMLYAPVLRETQRSLRGRSPHACLPTGLSWAAQGCLAAVYRYGAASNGAARVCTWPTCMQGKCHKATCYTPAHPAHVAFVRVAKGRTDPASRGTASSVDRYEDRCGRGLPCDQARAPAQSPPLPPRYGQIRTFLTAHFHTPKRNTRPD